MTAQKSPLRNVTHCPCPASSTEQVKDGTRTLRQLSPAQSKNAPQSAAAAYHRRSAGMHSSPMSDSHKSAENVSQYASSVKTAAYIGRASSRAAPSTYRASHASTPPQIFAAGSHTIPRKHTAKPPANRIVTAQRMSRFDSGAMSEQ